MCKLLRERRSFCTLPWSTLCSQHCVSNEQQCRWSYTSQWLQMRQDRRGGRMAWWFGVTSAVLWAGHGSAGLQTCKEGREQGFQAASMDLSGQPLTFLLLLLLVLQITHGGAVGCYPAVPRIREIPRCTKKSACDVLADGVSAANCSTGKMVCRHFFWVLWKWKWWQGEGSNWHRCSKGCNFWRKISACCIKNQYNTES